MTGTGQALNDRWLISTLWKLWQKEHPQAQCAGANVSECAVCIEHESLPDSVQTEANKISSSKQLPLTFVVIKDDI